MRKDEEGRGNKEGRRKGRIEHTFDIPEHDLDHGVAVRYIRARQMGSIHHPQQRLVDGVGVMLLFHTHCFLLVVSHLSKVTISPLRLDWCSKQGGLREAGEAMGDRDGV